MLRSIDNVEILKTQNDIFDFLKSNGFKISDYTIVNDKKAEEILDELVRLSERI